jgi:hypothetical protein
VSKIRNCKGSLGVKKAASFYAHGSSYLIYKDSTLQKQKIKCPIDCPELLKRLKEEVTNLD